MTFKIIPLYFHSGHSQSRSQVTSLTPPFLFPSVPLSVVSTQVDKATIFVKKIASNSSVDDSSATPPVNLPLSNHVLRIFFLSIRGIQSALAVLDVRKTYGPNGIPVILLRNCSW